MADTISASPVLSIAPVTLPAPGRAVDLQVRVSAPATGSGLPIIPLSHGHGRAQPLSSLDGYAPLANFWAARGLVVIQPTHLDSPTLSLGSDDPEAPLYWRTRAKDISLIPAAQRAVIGRALLTPRRSCGRVQVDGNAQTERLLHCGGSFYDGRRAYTPGRLPSQASTEAAISASLTGRRTCRMLRDRPNQPGELVLVQLDVGGASTARRSVLRRLGGRGPRTRRATWSGTP